MSKEIIVNFEVRSIEIMKNTLTQMGIKYSEDKSGNLKISKRWHNIVIDSKNGGLSYDEMDKIEVDKICLQYQLNWFRDAAIREGNEIREEVMSNGEVCIHVLN